MSGESLGHHPEAWCEQPFVPLLFLPFAPHTFAGAKGMAWQDWWFSEGSRWKADWWWEPTFVCGHDVLYGFCHWRSRGSLEEEGDVSEMTIWELFFSMTNVMYSKELLIELSCLGRWPDILLASWQMPRTSWFYITHLIRRTCMTIPWLSSLQTMVAPSMNLVPRPIILCVAASTMIGKAPGVYDYIMLVSLFPNMGILHDYECGLPAMLYSTTMLFGCCILGLIISSHFRWLPIKMPIQKQIHHNSIVNSEHPDLKNIFFGVASG